MNKIVMSSGCTSDGYDINKGRKVSQVITSAPFSENLAEITDKRLKP